jgi:hypothetical protein
MFYQSTNINFNNYVHLIYPDELKIKDTTEFDKSASYLDILPNIDSNGRLTTTLFDKCNDFDFAIVNFPFLCSNIPLSPAYGVYISQLIRCARACFAYEDFSKRGKLLTNKRLMGRIAHLSKLSLYRNIKFISFPFAPFDPRGTKILIQLAFVLYLKASMYSSLFLAS